MRAMKPRELSNTCFSKKSDRFLNQFSHSKHNVVKLGLITIYFDFLNHFEDRIKLKQLF